MALRDVLSTDEAGFRRYQSRRVLTGWLVLSLVIVGYVYGAVTNLLLPGTPMLWGFPFNAFVLGAVAIGGGGAALAFWSGRPLYAIGGAFFVGVSALSVDLGCPGVACLGEKQLHVFFEWTLLGPTISANFDAGDCVYSCPHTVELVPLLLGYLLVGETIIQAES
ncbi:MAG: hypothetical protein ABEH81_00140 [Halopenitus sp.]